MSTNEAESGQSTAVSGPSRIMSNQLATYYSNCAMIATSPRDISLYFGRLAPVQDNKGAQTLAELYEQQIYMTVEQAEDLARMLTQTVQVYKSQRQGSGSGQENPS